MKHTICLIGIYVIIFQPMFFCNSCCNRKLEDCKKAVINSPEFPDSLIKKVIYTSIESYNQKGYDSLVLRNTKNELFVFKFNYKRGFIPAEPRVSCDWMNPGCFFIINSSYFNSSFENPNCKINKIEIQNINQSIKEISYEFYNQFQISYKYNDTNKVFSSSIYNVSNKKNYVINNFNNTTVNINGNILTVYNNKYNDVYGIHFPLKKIYFTENYVPAIIYFNDDTLFNSNL